MVELNGKDYYKIAIEFVTAAELPENMNIDGTLYKKGDFVLQHENGLQAGMKREKFIKNYKILQNAEIVYDTIEKNKRLITI